uniref:Uncharacterized protein n=1 Tax=Seriola lalandi dorsalis TaxID=1841481 RepID=A0A3B4YYC5_SERLL
MHIRKDPANPLSCSQQPRWRSEGQECRHSWLSAGESVQPTRHFCKGSKFGCPSHLRQLI